MAERLDNLTALRFFAAFSVFLHHLRAFGLNLSESLWGLNLGWTVSFFFVLSGFVLSYSYSNRISTISDAARFVGVRFFRLWPLHIVCGVLALFLIGAPAQTDFAKLYLFLTLQHSWIPSYDTAFFLNGVSWSISVELFFYITFALLLLLGDRAMLIVISIWTVAVALLMLFVSWFPDAIPFSQGVAPSGLPSGVAQKSFFHLFPPVRAVEFFAGIVTYRVFRGVRMAPALIFPAQAICLLLVAIYVPFHRDIVIFLAHTAPRVFAQNYSHYGMFPLFALVVYVFAHERGPLSRTMSWPGLVFLGNISFALYMVHQIVITFLAMHRVPIDYGKWPAAFLAFVVSVVLSWLLYRFVELPGLRWAKRTFSPQRPPASIRQEPEPRQTADRAKAAASAY